MTDSFGRPYVAGSPPAPRATGEMPFVLFPPYVHGRVVAETTAPEPDAELPAWENRAPAQLPSIQEFVDTLPSIAEFTMDQPAATEWPDWGAPASPPAATAWESDDWQGYDWGSAARLGRAEPDAAAEAWASTDWSEPRHANASRQSAAEALASALDQIARRIRDGELSVPGSERVREDSAITAALAAVLGIKR